jgi:tetratricopeptide (TPR) repeat protein
MKALRHSAFFAGHFWLLAAACIAQTPPSPLDTIFLLRGEKVVAHVISLDSVGIRVQKPLPPPPGAPATATPVFATVTIARADVDRIEFAPDEVRDRKLKEAQPAQLAEVGAIWLKARPWLALPRSPAGRIGLAYADLLLRTRDPANAEKALAIAREVEAQTWDQDNTLIAKQTRLRAMVATGNAAEAIKEAVALEKISEDPEILIEAKYILADASDKALRKLVEENPRWEEDIFVIPERNRLYNEALDQYLYPYLFFGSQVEPSARGLWGAIEVYRFVGDQKQALEASRDLITIYPETSYAKLAGAFVATLPESLKKQDHEKEK